MNGKHANKKGIVSIEFVIITTLVLLPMLAGMVDLARLLRTDMILNRAAREGSINLMRNNDHVSAVNTYLTASGLDPANATISLSGSTGADRTLSITYQIPNLPLIPLPGLSFSNTVNVSTIYNRP